MHTIHRRITLILTILFLWWPPGLAAQQISLSISPPLIQLVIQPGKSVLVAYSVQNTGDPTVVSGTIYSFAPSNATGGITIKPLEGPVRFSLENSSFALGDPIFLDSQAKDQFLLRMRVPDGAPEGDYYYTFMVETDTGSAREGETVSRTQASVGANVLISVSSTGELDMKAAIKKFATRPHFVLPWGDSIQIFQSGTPLPVILQVANNGKNSIKTHGEITLRGSFGESLSYTVAPTTVLASSDRFLSATPSATIGCSPKICKHDTGLLVDTYLLGKYTATTTLSLGEQSPQLFSQFTFYALPLRELAVFVIGVIVVGGILRRIFKNKAL